MLVGATDGKGEEHGQASEEARDGLEDGLDQRGHRSTRAAVAAIAAGLGRAQGANVAGTREPSRTDDTKRSER
jgi:hypothetical protein